jgi:hypothetical protein
MDIIMIEQHLENIDRRLTKVEQILPTLATKAELHAAIAPLATKEELREEGERSRRHMDVIAESLSSNIQLLAEHVASTSQRKRPEQ